MQVVFGRQATQRHQGRDEVHIDVASGYRPAVATVRTGVPIRVVFHRHDDDPCTERVVFSSPRIERRLAGDGATSVDIPARQIGEIRYTCGMGRYSGTIRVTEATDGRLHWLRHRRSSLVSAATVIIIIIALGLPIVAALALLSLGSWAAIATTATAAATTAVAALWMFGIPAARRARARRTHASDDVPTRQLIAPDAGEPIRRRR